MRSATYLHDLLVATIFTEGLDADMDLWALGFCAVWVEGADVETFASACSLDPGTRVPCRLDEILDHADEHVWVAEVGSWIGAMPARTDGDFVRALSAGGRRAVSLDLDIGNHALFQYAVDGRLVVAFDPGSPRDRVFGDDPHALDHLMDGLRFELSGIEDGREDRVESDESISSALELIGRITETDMAADWFEASHFRIGSASR